jgi:uncharacterized protein YggE
VSDQSDSTPDRPIDELGHEHGHEHYRRGTWGPNGGRRHFGTRFVALALFAIVIAAIAFTGETLGHSRSSSAATITVTGSGTVTGTPNTMSFQIGVQTTALTAAGALDENNLQVGRLETSLLSNGIVKKNLQTSGLNIYTNTNQRNQITGFTVSDELNVTTHQIKKAGAALDAAAKAVGNGIQLNGVTFSISNQSKLLAAARARAIKNAHTEAVQIAKGAGTTVVAVVKVVDQENSGTTGIVYPVAYAMNALTSSVPIQRGSQSISVQVQVVYSLSS